MHHLLSFTPLAGARCRNPVIEVWSRAKVLKHLKKYNKVGNRHYANTDENNLEMYAAKVRAVASAEIHAL